MDKSDKDNKSSLHLTIKEILDDQKTARVTVFYFGEENELLKEFISCLLVTYHNVEYRPIIKTNHDFKSIIKHNDEKLEVNPFVGSVEMFFLIKPFCSNRVIYTSFDSSFLKTSQPDALKEFLGNFSDLMSYRDLLVFSNNESTNKSPHELTEIANSKNLLIRKAITHDLGENKIGVVILLKGITQLWRRTDDLFFSFIGPERFDEQPILLRNKFLFYLGHLSNFYDIRVLGLKSTDPYFIYFERGRDPDVDNPEHCHRHSNINIEYPPYQEVVKYNEKVRENILLKLVNEGYTFKLMASMEHEMMHQETLMYMIRMTHSDAFRLNLPQEPYKIPEKKLISIPKRVLKQGSDETFAWDNEHPCHLIEVEAFEVDNLPVTWGEMLEFIRETELYKTDMLPNFNEKLQFKVSATLFIDFEIAQNFPAWVCLKVAKQYLDWLKQKKGLNCRIMTESEFDSLSTTLISTSLGNVDFKHHHPVPVGYYNDFSKDGVGELFGNGWELTSSNFLPFEGFKPLEIYDEYSKDFFSSDYYVIKGGSPFTPRELLRKSLRNWFQYNYVYHLSKFRLVYEKK